MGAQQFYGVKLTNKWWVGGERAAQSLHVLAWGAFCLLPAEPQQLPD